MCGESMVCTINELYLSTRRALRTADCDMAEMEAKLLLCHALQCTKEDLLQNAGSYVGEEVQKTVSHMTRRRLAGEPLAYITGQWEFCGLPIAVSSDVLIPRSDTEVLVEEALKLLRKDNKAKSRILDLACGSGCIGIALAHYHPQSTITALDISPAAVQMTKKNVERNSLKRRFIVLEGDILAPPARSMGQYNMIVSNPPYIATAELASLDASVVDYEPSLALDGGEDGYKFYRSILTNWLSLLALGGYILMEIGEGQAQTLMELMQNAGLQEVHSVLDYYGTPRIVVGKR